METKIQPREESHDRPSVTVKIQRGKSAGQEFTFDKDFKIGREKECEIILTDDNVSRVHTEVEFARGSWWINDVESTNGTFKGGARISHIPVKGRTSVSLGVGGPRLVFEIKATSKEDLAAATQLPSVTNYKQHYFDDKTDLEAGQHTRMIRQAYKEVRKAQSTKYTKIIIALAVLTVAAITYGWIKQVQLERQKQLAQDVFYKLKSLEITNSKIQAWIARTGDSLAQSEASRNQVLRQELTNSYNSLIDEMGIYSDMSEEERTIYHVARIFGECELTMPEEFVNEVLKYVREWKLSSRLVNAIQRAEKEGYPEKIAQIMLAKHLPPQFMYLALQESDLDVTKVGPNTRYGIAKGMWQFIPTTAVEYGLRTGPLVHMNRDDPRDERQDFEKSTEAAASYLQDIYNGEAQASGLLVCASYNWGHNLVRGLIKKMPETPQERNFWQFFLAYRDKIPKETYNYVFYIFSAAVISENPKLFGFDFERPFPATLPQVANQ
jgi:pSer/pThr/pTyr-binding forkhead associated (FHA) protein